MQAASLFLFSQPDFLLLRFWSTSTIAASQTTHQARYSSTSAYFRIVFRNLFWTSMHAFIGNIPAPPPRTEGRTSPVLPIWTAGACRRFYASRLVHLRQTVRPKAHTSVRSPKNRAIFPSRGRHRLFGGCGPENQRNTVVLAFRRQSGTETVFCVFAGVVAA